MMYMLLALDMLIWEGQNEAIAAPHGATGEATGVVGLRIGGKISGMCKRIVGVPACTRCHSPDKT